MSVAEGVIEEIHMKTFLFAISFFHLQLLLDLCEIYLIRMS